MGDLTLLRPLVMAGIPVVVATPDPKDPTLRSRHARETCILPGLTGRQGDAASVALCRLADKITDQSGMRPPLFYGSDESLAFIYSHREDIERHFSVLLNDHDVAEALLYKDRFAELARERGVLVPRTLASSEEIDAGLSSIDGPVVIKPKSKVTKDDAMRALFGLEEKAVVFASASELEKAEGFAACKDRIVVQEAIDGAEEDLVSFHGFSDDRGRLLASFTGRKIRTFPKTTGESSCIELVVDEAAAQAGARVAAQLGLKGVFKIDLIRDPRTGIHYALEVNARFNLWHHLAAADGINIPKVAYEYVLFGMAPLPHAYEPQHLWLDLYRDWKSYRQRSLTGELGLFGWLSSLTMRPPLFEAFAWDDPAPALGWLGSMVQGKLSRWRSTGS